MFPDLQLSDSGLYTCTATSESGETSWSAALTVEKQPGAHLHRSPDPSTFPLPPGRPSILNATQSSVTVSWEQQSTPVTLIGYTLEYYSPDLQTGWVVATHRLNTNTVEVSERNYLDIFIVIHLGLLLRS